MNLLTNRGKDMNFLEYIKWLFYSTVNRNKTCNTCIGSNGHCDKCDELKRNLYKRDWNRWHDRKYH